MGFSEETFTLRLEEWEETHPCGELSIGNGEDGPERRDPFVRSSRKKRAWPSWVAERLRWGTVVRNETRREAERDYSVTHGGPKYNEWLQPKYRGKLFQCWQRHHGTVCALERFLCCYLENTLEGGWTCRQSAWGDYSVQVTGDSGLQRQEVSGFKRENKGWILERGWKWVEGSEEKMAG